MGRICITIPDELEERAGKESEEQAITKSDWFIKACEHFVRNRDQDCAKVIATLQDLKLQAGILEERSMRQAELIDSLRKDKVHLEGLTQQLMQDRQVLLPERAGFWSRLFGKS